MKKFAFVTLVLLLETCFSLNLTNEVFNNGGRIVGGEETNRLTQDWLLRFGFSRASDFAQWSALSSVVASERPTRVRRSDNFHEIHHNCSTLCLSCEGERNNYSSWHWLTSKGRRSFSGQKSQKPSTFQSIFVQQRFRCRRAEFKNYFKEWLQGSNWTSRSRWPDCGWDKHTCEWLGWNYEWRRVKQRSTRR